MLPLLALAGLAGFVTDAVAYGPDPKQQVDVTHVEASATAAPIVIFFHGGVWQMGDRRDVRHVGLTLASAGFVAVTASYRLAPAHRWPAQIDDAAAVVALAVKNAAAWGGDPSRIVLVGHSAGGQLVSLLALDPSRLRAVGVDPAVVRAVVAISGVFDLRGALDEGQADGGRARFIAPVFGADLAVLRAASPIDRLAPLGARQAIVPFLLITGTDDYTAMQGQTEAMARAMTLRGTKPTVVVVADRDHFGLVGALGRPGDDTTRALTRFLRRTLSLTSTTATQPAAP